MNTPDITSAQILAVLKSAAAVAIAFGLPLTSVQQVALLSLAGVLSSLLIAADAAIRRARAQHLAAPIADHAAATALTAARSSRTADTIASEAKAEQAAQAANDAAAAAEPDVEQPADGVDPATQQPPPA